MSRPRLADAIDPDGMHPGVASPYDIELGVVPNIKNLVHR
jgi:hypothetical protein